MFVSDIDGTLIDRHGVISEANRRALQKLKDRGIPVILATGRTWGGTQEVWEQLDLSDPVIVCNGAQVYDPVSKQFLWDQRLTFDEVRAAETMLQDLPVQVYAVVSDSLLLVHQPEKRAGFKAFSGDRYAQVDNVFQYLRETGTRPVKIFVLGEPDVIPGAVATLRERGGLNAVQSEPYAFDILAPGTSKASALTPILQRFGMSPQHIVAVGNAPNDVELVDIAGLGFAVGDAHPSLLQVADHVTAPAALDGVAEAVHRAFPSPMPAPVKAAAPA